METGFLELPRLLFLTSVAGASICLVITRGLLLDVEACVSRDVGQLKVFGKGKGDMQQQLAIFLQKGIMYFLLNLGCTA